MHTGREDVFDLFLAVNAHCPAAPDAPRKRIATTIASYTPGVGAVALRGSPLNYWDTNDWFVTGPAAAMPHAVAEAGCSVPNASHNGSA